VKPKLAELGDVAVRRWLPLIVGMGVGIRLALALVHGFRFPDSADYDLLARNILEGKAYEAGGNFASRMPGYPILVAGVYALAGYSVKAVLVVQALLSGALIGFTYALARRVGTAVALLAAGLVAFDPLTVAFSATFLTEMPFTLCLMVALWLCLRLSESPRWPHWVELGLVWGAGVMLRVSALWCIVPLLAWVVWQMPVGAKRQRIAGPFIVLALIALMLAPWLVRNYRMFDSGPFRMTTLEGISLYEAVYPEADGGPRQDKISLPPEMASLNEAQRNDEWSRRAWTYVREEPLRVAKLAVVKAGRTWSPWFNAGEWKSRVITWGMAAWYIPVYALAIAGIFWGRMRRQTKMLLMIPVLYFTVLHALFLGSVRYRVPLMPEVCVLAACGASVLRKGEEAGQRSAEARV